jgi:hypothetical protein
MLKFYEIMAVLILQSILGYKDWLDKNSGSRDGIFKICEGLE